MTTQVITLLDLSAASPVSVIAPPTPASGSTLADTRGRLLRDLRISVTDRCNFRCTYCMPKSVFDKDYRFLPQGELLSFDEITRMTRLFVAQGVEKIRLTGGEPLLRRNIEVLIGMLSTLNTHDGKPLDIALTTNGSLLANKAQALKAAGLRRVTVSLDSLDETIFRAMNDVAFPVSDVLNGIDAAHAAGFTAIKINMVVKKGVNDQDVVAMARHFKGSGHIVRFIEFMDVGSCNGWRMNDVVTSADIVRMINAEMPLIPAQSNYRGEVAQRWAYADGSGEIGVISSVTQAFCATCTRARLSTDGKLYTCLFAQSGHDLRTLMRAGQSDQQIAAAIGLIWTPREDGYSQIRTEQTARNKKVEMSYIGG
ncbi:GTP 3',8-cyclase MoaA [Pseudomonas sp. RTC3]|uniref:GTP 3',8-cyclase MoaA n=1 Tax=unclassified Pseudomonas TaxID=196821 RepID=UPI002AB37C86|nr:MULTISPECIES: GTP 3',8-cyclase MoaA [unclassified Pseudomonas]MEB0063854.1 GTP 3',8-cyclase MoaA [Pseudomonas sp. RTC3]MDY7565007.1 GTP 3',8-cyclase MoaA [Pseudomonas sp. 5C2]MEB0025270.1 GTP 3',8-cyclase MoaA [Pseudomonas sp. MH9.2]MEB0242208.1 GTP 3',8-cyclase MoaA [Pseudomonas sp. 5C2]WPX69159.1 GTP 3',8-cyclase MoaA [Pseudomonas sp. MH9.2]